jgi:dTMP kinase
VNTSLFICFEGTDGSGTTTQGNLLAAELQRQGRTVLRTAQPSDGQVGRLIRAALRGETVHRLDPATVALLFAADRVDHCRHVIAPALARGEVVICDRYLGSSLAFQVVDGEGAIDVDWVMRINREALVPDATILMDLPVDQAVHRIVARGKPRERYEIEDTLQRVRTKYRALFAAPPPQLGHTVMLDAQRSREAIADDVLHVVTQALAERATPLLPSAAGLQDELA